MINTVKEVIEDERIYIKSNYIDKGYVKNSRVNNFITKTTVEAINKYKCYKLNVKISDKHKNMELNTYVTQKQ